LERKKKGIRNTVQTTLESVRILIRYGLLSKIAH